MSIFDEKLGDLLETSKYKDFLNFELTNYNSKIINNLITDGEYQEAINFVMSHTNKNYSIPLKVEPSLSGMLNGLILNDKLKFDNFFVHLKKELLNAEEFVFVVSFIKYSGIQILISTLDELEKRGIKGKILTSVYMNVTDPKALEKLHSYKNIEVKIYNSGSESFHTKAYLFKKKSYNTCIIGSSNISQSALFSAEEWNVFLTENSYMEIYKNSKEQFEKLWNSNLAIDLTENFINEYENFKSNNGFIKTFNYEKIKKNVQISPNNMQMNVLENLELTRIQGEERGLVIAATGTGKTYLAGFDFKQSSFKSFLFLAHREELLINARKVFSKILNIPENKFGYIGGGIKNTDSKMIFATVQSFNKIKDMFDSTYFEYIVIDEFHHASAKTYEQIIRYFSPKFLLGLTATPERMDGEDIFKLCNYNIVSEIGLKEALDKELIAPFHYFGINDINVDYDKIPLKNGIYDDTLLTHSLNTLNRLDYITEKIQNYGYNGNRMHCIAFCQNIKHAEFMCKGFNSKGFKAEILTSKSNTTERSNVLKAFDNGDVEILCVVDILNEGIDIPKINLLLFLRPTSSSTIFIQQLGRGLRKLPEKDFVTVIDFIGNHNKDYLLAKVFSNERTLQNKCHLIKEIETNFSNFPGASYIEIDRICQERIIKKIEKINFNSSDMLRNEYLEFKNALGLKDDEIIEVMYFEQNIELFVKLINKFSSLHDAYKYLENSYNEIIDENTYKILKFLDNKIDCKEPLTLIAIRMKLDGLVVNEETLLKEYLKLYNIGDFKYKYLIKRIISELEEESFFVGAEEKIYKRINETIKFALWSFNKTINIKDFNENVLIKYDRYTRLELQILLDSKVPKGTWRSGYANTARDICLFITNDKEHVNVEHLKYDNSLISDQLIKWSSQPKTAHTSSVGQMFINHAKIDMNVHIFIRKSPYTEDKKTSPFIYLGLADYHESSGDKPMNIVWKLKNRIPQSIIYEINEE